MQCPIQSIKQLNPGIITNPKKGKELRLDCFFEVEDGILVDIEVQRQKEDYDPERLLNYLSGMNQLLLQRGRSHMYGRSILIYLSEYRIGEPDQYHQAIEMRLPNGISVSDRLQIISLQLTDLQAWRYQDINAITQLQRVMLYFKYAHRKEYQHLIQALCEKEEELMAIHKDMLSEQEALQQYYQLRDIIDEQHYQKRMERLKQEKEKERQMRIEEQQKRKISDEIIHLMEQGYSLEDAKRKVLDHSQKY